MSTDSSIDELIEGINSLGFKNNLDQGQDISITMTNQPQPQAGVNYQLLQMYIQSIPDFNGNPLLLDSFIEGCNELVQNYFSPQNQTLNNFLLRSIKNKLKDKALIAISTRLDLTNWDEIKHILQISFGDPRDLDTLQQDLIYLTYQQNIDTLTSFGQKVQQHLSLLMSKLNSSQQAEHTKIALSDVYNKFALNTYTRSLPFSYQQLIRIRNIINLDDAIQAVACEEQFRHYSNTVNKNQNQTPKQNHSKQTRPIQNPVPQTSQRQFSTQPTFQQRQFSTQPTFQQRQFSTQPNFQQRQFSAQPAFQQKQFSTQPVFPSQPLNIQQRQQPVQRKFYTNKEVFGKPTNAFKSYPNQNQNYRPTPMSGVSSFHQEVHPLETQNDDLSYDNELTDSQNFEYPENNDNPEIDEYFDETNQPFLDPTLLKTDLT